MLLLTEFHNWLKNYRRQLPSNSRVRRGKLATAQIRVSQLEDRTLLAATVAPVSTPAIPSATALGANASVSDDGMFVVYTSDAANLVSGQVDANNTTDVFVLDRNTGTTKLVSHITGGLGTAGNGASTNAKISSDGTKVVFETVATNLVSGVTDANGSGKDVYVYDVATEALSLVSHTSSFTTTGSGSSLNAQVNTNGSLIAFETVSAPLAAGITDANAAADIYLYKVSDQSLTLVSHNATALTTAAGAASTKAQISGDGTRVVFETLATDLVTGNVDTGIIERDVYSYLVSDGSLTLISHTTSAITAANNDSYNAQISEDGLTIVFESIATNLGTGFTDGNAASDIFVSVGGTVSIVSHSAVFTTTATGASANAQISADGTKIVFQTVATDLVGAVADANAGTDVYVYTVSTQALALASHTSSTSTAGNALSRNAQISNDGTSVVFETLASNLGTGFTDTGSTLDVFQYNVGTNTLVLVSHSSAGLVTAANNASSKIQISGDGTFVAFESAATNIVADDFDLATSTLLGQDLSTPAVFEVLSIPAIQSVTAAGANASVSDDGRYVVFTSAAANLMAGQIDVNNASDVFLLDRQTGITTLVSHTTSLTTAANGAAINARISGNGTKVVFESLATNHIAGSDTNSASDVYVYDVATGGLKLVSHTTVLTTAANGAARNAQISADGSRIAFETLATNHVSGITDTFNANDVYVYTVSSQALALVSHTNSLTTAGNARSQSARLSGDGSLIVFDTQATNVGAGQGGSNGTALDVYLYTVSTGAITLVSHISTAAGTVGNNESANAQISRDGTRIVFESHATDLIAGNTDSNSTANDIYAFTVSTGALVLVSHVSSSVAFSGNGASGNGRISADGSLIVFDSLSNDLLSGVSDTNGVSDVFLYQVGTGGVTLVSHTSGNFNVTGNGASANAQISLNGGRIAYQSTASNLAAGVTDSNAANDVYLYQVTGGTMTLVSHNSVSLVTAGNGFSRNAQINADGSYITFESVANNIVAGDFDLTGTLFGFSENAPPTAVNFTGTTTVLDEGTVTTPKIHLANIVVVDDGLGTNTLTLSGPDAAFFVIENGMLYLAPGTNLNYAAKPSYSVVVNATDLSLGAGPHASSATFTLNLNDVNLAPSAPGPATLPAVAEDTTNPTGATLTSLVGALFADGDAGASMAGAAVVSNTAAAQGTWQYSTDGTNWFNIGTVSGGSALALTPSSSIRFVPVANFSGSPPSISVRVLDNTYAGLFTVGNTKQLINTSPNGGNTAIAGTATTIQTTITPIGDAPLVTNGFTTRGYQTVVLPITKNAVDGAEITHFKITGIVGGTLTKANGVTPVNSGDVITKAEATAGLRFTPNLLLISPTATFSFDVQAATSAGGAGLSTATTASVVVEDLSGTWFVNGGFAHILQSGSSLTIINKQGVGAAGTLTSGTTLTYDPSGPTGTITTNQIDWSNGAVWTRSPLSSIPDLDEVWTVGGGRAQLQQQGAELLLTNKSGGVTRARLTSATTFVAADWNLTGTLSNFNLQIDFSNGAVWTVRSVIPLRDDISGAWSTTNGWAQIRQSGDQLSLINANGNISPGTFDVDNVTITAEAWGITGNYSGTAINWSNGSIWTPDTFSVPALSHSWTIGGLVAQIDPNGGELLLTNKAGSTSRAVWRLSSQIYAVDWNIVGDLTNSNNTLTWSSGSVWTSAPSGIDALFAADFNPFD